MRAGNSCKKSLSLRKFSLSVLLIFLVIASLASSAGAVDFWDITVVDSTGDVGECSSLAILPTGQPAISYFDYTNKDLKYTQYDGSFWQTTTVDSEGSVGWYTSLAILPSGRPAIAYYDSTNDDLKYAWYDGSTWQTTIVDSTGDVGRSSSLAILPLGHPAVSYHDNTNDDLKYAWYDGSTWQTTIVDSAGNVGDTSLAILPSGQPAISYHDANNDLNYAWHDGSAWQTQIVDSNGGSLGVSSSCSLAILPSGQPAISYHDWPNLDLRYGWYDGSTWQTEIVDSPVCVGRYTSLAVLASGRPAISYFLSYGGECDASDDLKYAWYDGTTWRTTTVDSPGHVGYSTSLAILPSSQPGISYHDGTNDDLKFAAALDVAAVPVGMAPSYTAKAWSEWGGVVVADNEAACNMTYVGQDGSVKSSASLETTMPGGHLQGLIALTGWDGVECMDYDPETGECIWWGVFSCGNANGTVTGTIVLRTCESYPADSELYLGLDVIVWGDPGDAEDYHLKLWRGVSLIGQVNAGAPEAIIVPVFAGETLTFELFASEEDWYGNYEGYDREFEFRLILRGPANIDGKGAVDFRDYAIFAPHWWDTGCTDPNWCGKADLDKSGDVNWPDLKIFTDHWLE